MFLLSPPSCFFTYFHPTSSTFRCFQISFLPFLSFFPSLTDINCLATRSPTGKVTVSYFLPTSPVSHSFSFDRNFILHHYIRCQPLLSVQVFQDAVSAAYRRVEKSHPDEGAPAWRSLHCPLQKLLPQLQNRHLDGRHNE